MYAYSINKHSYLNPDLTPADLHVTREGGSQQFAPPHNFISLVVQ